MISFFRKPLDGCEQTRWHETCQILHSRKICIFPGLQPHVLHYVCIIIQLLTPSNSLGGHIFVAKCGWPDGGKVNGGGWTGSVTIRIGPVLFGCCCCDCCCACSSLSWRVLARRVEDQISSNRFWRDLSFALTAPCLVSWFPMDGFLCLPTFPSYWCCPLLRSSTNSGHKKVLAQVSGTGFALLAHDNWSPGLVTPVYLMCDFRWPWVSVVPWLWVVMSVLAFVWHIFIMCFILRFLTHVPCLLLSHTAFN